MSTPNRIHWLILSTLILLACGCSDEIATPPPAEPVLEATAVGGNPGRINHATGQVQLVWKGSANAPTGAHGDSVRFAEAAFDAHEPDGRNPAKGTFYYRVISESGTLHREVTAAIEGVAIDAVAQKVWYIGRVIADTKGCSGGPGGGHDTGCGGDTGGGCSDGHDDGHDGGCSDGHDEGGCSDGGHDTGGGDTGGGCPDGTHDETEGGCPDGGHDPGEPGGSGGPSGATGRSCRIGQMIVGKAHDGGSPGAPYDGITWKWFLADDPDLPSIDDLASWPHLCKKEITGGNLVIHVPGRPEPTLDRAP